MKTNFTEAQMARPEIALANPILRSCVHCGFCTATCPTYQILGDELDSPRGRIYLIKDMLEHDRSADEKTVLHIDRCLSCLACVSTCPSGVDYMHLIDTARDYVEKTYRRPVLDRITRAALARILPFPERFRLAVSVAKLARRLQFLFPGKIRSVLAMAPQALPPRSKVDQPRTIPAAAARKKRVALLAGCVQSALDPDITGATIRLLSRLGCEVVIAKGAGCCGALTHHMGRSADSHAFALANIDAWSREAELGGLDAIIITTSGCGTTVKDYGHMFRNHPMAAKAAVIASLARDVSEFVAEVGIKVQTMPNLRVAYHAACSLQHGQKIRAQPIALLAQAGFQICEPADPHLCCGSAGTYNILQPDLSAELRRRKVSTLEKLRPQIIAAGNIGCMYQIARGTDIPVVHTVELLDWATGGPKPAKLHALATEAPN